jgi:hypothetical protein
MNLSAHNNLFTLFLKSIVITIIVFLFMILCWLLIKYLNICPFFDQSFGYGTFGDFIGGFIGTVAAIATLIVVSKSFNQVHEQALQNTVALLLQAYQHTIEDYDFNDSDDKPLHGREAIKESLKKRTDKNYLSESFPTHIPAIIVSILYTIDDSGHDKKNALYKQIKTMLSFEERQLLLLYLLELQGSPNSKDAEDYEKDKNLLLESIFKNGVNSKSLVGFEEIYKKIYGPS